MHHHTLCKLGEVGGGRVIVGCFLMTKEGKGNNRVTELFKAHVRVDCSTAVRPASIWYLQKKCVAILTESCVVIYSGDG